jgi:hypothetical protein
MLSECLRNTQSGTQKSSEFITAHPQVSSRERHQLLTPENRSNSWEEDADQKPGMNKTRKKHATLAPSELGGLCWTTFRVSQGGQRSAENSTQLWSDGRSGKLKTSQKRHPITLISPQRTNSMELSPSWEAASCAATQEFSNILCNQKVNLPCSPSTAPYPEPDQSSPYHPFIPL